MWVLMGVLHPQITNYTTPDYYVIIFYLELIYIFCFQFKQFDIYYTGFNRTKVYYKSSAVL